MNHQWGCGLGNRLRDTNVTHPCQVLHMDAWRDKTGPDWYQKENDIFRPMIWTLNRNVPKTDINKSKIICLPHADTWTEIRQPSIRSHILGRNLGQLAKYCTNLRCLSCTEILSFKISDCSHLWPNLRPIVRHGITAKWWSCD